MKMKPGRNTPPDGDKRTTSQWPPHPGGIRSIPESTSIWRRPVYERLLKRKHLMPLAPPTRREYEDALRVLAEQVDDELQAEALLIIDERQ